MKTQEAKYPERINEDSIATIPFELIDGSPATLDVLCVLPEEQLTEIPTIVIPGFTEGITQDAKFAHELSEATHGVVLVAGQYEREEKDFIRPKNALENQALAVLAIVERLGLQHEAVNVFANSLGAPVFSRAAELAAEREWTCFTEEDSSVVFMAPAGVKKFDNFARVGKRFGWNGAIRAHVSEDDGWDADSLAAGQKLFGADLKKAAGEGLLAATAHVDFKMLKDLGITPSIVTSPKDGVMGQKALGKSIVRLMEAGYVESWSTPYSMDTRGLVDISQAEQEKLTKKEAKKIAFNGNSGAEHNTHMVNDAQARRTAKAVATLLNKHYIAEKLTDTNN